MRLQPTQLASAVNASGDERASELLCSSGSRAAAASWLGGNAAAGSGQEGRGWRRRWIQPDPRQERARTASVRSTAMGRDAGETDRVPNGGFADPAGRTGDGGTVDSEQSKGIHGGHGGAPAGERGVREEDEGESKGGGEEQGGGVRPGCPLVAAPARPLMRAGSGGSKSSIWSSSPRSRSGQEDGERWRRNTGTSGLDRPRRAGCGLRRCKHGAGS